MTWTQSWGSTSFTTVDTIPCWDLNAGSLVTTTRTTLGDIYTLFYYWKPRVSDTEPHGFRTMHRGTSDHWATVGFQNKHLGVYSDRNGDSFRDSGYDITIEWQTLIVTGVATSTGSHLGTSTFYVNGMQVGTADRVGSGTQTYTIGGSTSGPPLSLIHI